MKRKATSDVWWKNVVFYCLDVETFLDTDGDGCGDLPGLCERVDYLTRARHRLPLADASKHVLNEGRRRR